MSDEGKKPPQSAEELLERYAAGERDFRGADLCRVDLRGANLRGANLRWANLIGTNLNQADLTGANLIEVELRGASLCGTDFRGAILGGANLSKAELRGANLTQAFLYKTDFSGATVGLVVFGPGGHLFFTLLVDVDCSTAVLDNIKHIVSSSVGVDTLQRTAEGLSKNPSNQGAVEAFFRGCGVSDDQIDLFRSWIGRPIEMYSAFISHSHANKLFSRRLHDQLQAKGIRCWLDEKDMVPGQRILDVVNQAIRAHDKLLVVCSEASLSSWWVKTELRNALEREQREKRDIIIPVMLDHYLINDWEDGLAVEVRSRLAADFTGWEHDNAVFERQFERVVAALRPRDIEGA